VKSSCPSFFPPASSTFRIPGTQKLREDLRKNKEEGEVELPFFFCSCCFDSQNPRELKGLGKTRKKEEEGKVELPFFFCPCFFDSQNPRNPKRLRQDKENTRRR